MTTTQDTITYLNVGDDPRLKPALLKAVEALPAKIQTQPAAQWLQTLKSLPGKGQVRAAELADSGMIEWLALQDKARLTREQILDRIKLTATTVKEVVLARPEYGGWTHATHMPGSVYQELLFQAMSEKMVVEDALEEVEWEIEQNAFDFGDVERMFELEKKRKALLIQQVTAHEYHAPHFFQKDQFGERYAKNLFAHARVVIDKARGLYLIDEVQSDWAQKGRGKDWPADIPKGAFVTETKSWAGLVLRRLMQRAAQIPEVRSVAWIRSGLHNGGMTVEPGKRHDDFYMQILRGIADSSLKPLGGAVEVKSLQIGNTLVPDLCQFEMTDRVREGLAGPQPLYSRAQLLPGLYVDVEAERAQWPRLVEAARHMVGSRVHLQLLDRVWDIAHGNQVAGRQAGEQILISMRARDKDFVVNHECWHYAHDYLITRNERIMVEDAFRPGTMLNQQVRHLLMQRGDLQAVRQCADPKEAAAHGFGLFVAGALDVREPKTRGLFATVWQAFRDIAAWMRSVAQDRPEATELYDLFEGVRAGAYSPDKVQRLEPQATGEGEDSLAVPRG